MDFKNFLLSEKTLYHGTTADNKNSIEKYGLVGGWQGHIGKFVSNFYGDDDSGRRPTEDDEIVYATDKNNLHKAINAMEFHISEKLGKSYYDVSENDIRNHGLIVIIKNGEEKTNKYDSENDGYDELPIGLEDGDYYSHSSIEGDLYLTGTALIRFLKNQGYINPNQKIKNKLIGMAIKRGIDRNIAITTVNKADIKDIKNQIRYYEKN